jgi:single stranded DNA-binding protein
VARGNIAVISGNLTGDPQFHTFPSGTEKATFQLAWNEDRKLDDGTWEKRAHYFEIECWAGNVTIARKFKKGNLITVYGRASWRKWEKDGQQFEKVSFVADSLFGDHMYDKADGSVPQSQGEPRQRSGGGGAGTSSASDSPPRTRGSNAPQPDAVPAALNDAGDPSESDDPPWI